MRTLITLTLAQSFAACGGPIVVLLGGIIGTQIAPRPALATLPIALMIVGTALTTVPAALFMGRFGRKVGFMCGAGYACGAGLLAIWAVVHGNFWVFCVATFNTRLPVAEVMVNGEQFCVIRPRPDYDALISLDRMPVWLENSEN